MRLRPSRRERYDAYFGSVPTHDIGRRAARGSAVSVGSQVIKLLATLGTLAILARLLTPADYGLLAMLLTFTTFIAVFRDFGLSSATIQRDAVSESQVSALFWVSLLVGTLLAIAALLLAPVAAWFFHDDRLTGAIAVSSIGFVFAGASAQHLALLSRTLRFGAFAFADVGSLIVASALGILLAVNGAGYWSLVLMQPALPLVQMVLAFALAGWTPLRPRRAAGVREMLRFGGNLTGHNFLTYFARNGDNILLGRFYSPADLGAYTRAYSVLLAPISQLSIPIGNVFLPTLSRIGAQDIERYRSAYLRTLSKLCIVTMPLVAFSIATSDWIIRLILGPQWSAAAQIFFFLGFAGLVEPIANSLSWLFISQNRTSEILRWSAYNLPLTILAFLIGLPYGPEGVAASYAVYSVARMPAMFWYVGRSGPVRAFDFYSAAVPGALAAAAVFATVGVLRISMDLENSIVSLVLAAGVAGLTGALALLASRAGRREVRDMGHLASQMLSH